MKSKRQLNTFRLAQTEIGSYIFNIESDDYNTIEDQMTMDGVVEVPTVRRSIERIQKGLSFVKHEEDTDRLKELSYRIGLNANMCDSLLEIKNVDQSMNVETYIDYCDAYNDVYSVSENLQVSLDERDFSKLRMLSDYYRNLENYKDITIEGKITTLNARWKDSISGILLENVISVSWYSSLDKRSFNCKVQLTSDEYKLACDAHRDNKKIQVSGKIDENRTRWFLEYHKGFTVL